MADTAAVAAPAPAPAAAASPAKKAAKSAAAASKKPRGKPAHPRTSEMVNGAIKALKERGGSSLQAIKKYISANYKVDAEKLSPFIKKYLKSAVTSGELVQTKGKGASGSFKLSSAKPAAAAGAHGHSASGGVAKVRKSTVGKVAAAKKKSVKAVTKRASSAGSPAKKKSSAIKKKSASAASPAAKKAPAAKAAKASVAAKPKKAAAPAAASKVQKKVTKVPTKKPKAPKPKKAVAAKAKPSSPAKKATSTSRSRK